MSGSCCHDYCVQNIDGADISNYEHVRLWRLVILDGVLFFFMLPPDNFREELVVACNIQTSRHSAVETVTFT